MEDKTAYSIWMALAFVFIVLSRLLFYNKDDPFSPILGFLSIGFGLLAIYNVWKLTKKR